MPPEEMRNVWAIHTVDTTGKRTDVYVGQVEHENRLEAALRVDNGPIVVIPLPQVAGDILAAIRQTSLNAYVKNAEDHR